MQDTIASALSPEAPVIIGGLGGSGTRVVARMLSEMGFFLGNDLNPEYDNLAFTLLFKRPSCVAELRDKKTDAIRHRLNVLAQCMLGLPRETGTVDTLLRAASEMRRTGHNYRQEGNGLWPFVRAWKLLRSTAPRKARGWGWKEPNAHVYLDHLIAHFPRMKYIHVMRHGLDMAFSGNRQQLFLWAELYDMDPMKTGASEPATALEYWIRANRKAVDTGRKLGSRFLLCNFDALCDSPRAAAATLIDFLGLKDAVGADFVAGLARTPSSAGRYKSQISACSARSNSPRCRSSAFRSKSDMRIVAILAAYNEERFIAACLDHLIAQGVEVYLLNNDSTDQTVEIASRYLNRGLITIERLPRENVFDLHTQMARKEDLAKEIEADWFMHVDADEFHVPPAGDLETGARGCGPAGLQRRELPGVHVSADTRTLRARSRTFPRDHALVLSVSAVFPAPTQRVEETARARRPRVVRRSPHRLPRAEDVPAVVLYEALPRTRNRPCDPEIRPAKVQREGARRRLVEMALAVHRGHDPVPYRV